jgi:hypothetical protein
MRQSWPQIWEDAFCGKTACFAVKVSEGALGVGARSAFCGKMLHFPQKMKIFRNERYRVPDTRTVLEHSGKRYFRYFFSNFDKNQKFSIFDFLKDLR